MCDWRRDRFDWMHQIMAHPDLTPTAKMLAAVFATRFADVETGESFPSKAALAEAIGRTAKNGADMVKIAIRELETRGWLIVARARGRGRSSTYTLNFPAGCAPSERGNVVPLSEAREHRKRGNGGGAKGGMQSSPILEPRGTQQARARGGRPSRPPAAPPSGRPPTGRAIPEEFVACPKRLDAWSDWIARKGWPSLDVMGLRGLRGGEAGASLPFGWPPSEREAEDTATAAAFFALKAGDDVAAQVARLRA